MEVREDSDTSRCCVRNHLCCLLLLKLKSTRTADLNYQNCGARAERDGAECEAQTVAPYELLTSFAFKAASAWSESCDCGREREAKRVPAKNMAPPTTTNARTTIACAFMLHGIALPKPLKYGRCDCGRSVRRRVRFPSSADEPSHIFGVNPSAPRSVVYRNL